MSETVTPMGARFALAQAHAGDVVRTWCELGANGETVMVLADERDPIGKVLLRSSGIPKRRRRPGAARKKTRIALLSVSRTDLARSFGDALDATVSSHLSRRVPPGMCAFLVVAHGGSSFRYLPALGQAVGGVA